MRQIVPILSIFIILNSNTYTQSLKSSEIMSIAQSGQIGSTRVKQSIGQAYNLIPFEIKSDKLNQKPIVEFEVLPDEISVLSDTKTITRLEMLNVKGRIIQSQFEANSKLSIMNTQNIQTGTYYLKVIHSDASQSFSKPIHLRR